MFEFDKIFIKPNWDNNERVHDWKNHINEDLRLIWESFNDVQKVFIGRNAQEIADAEQWD